MVQELRGERSVDFVGRFADQVKLARGQQIVFVETVFADQIGADHVGVEGDALAGLEVEEGRAAVGAGEEERGGHFAAFFCLALRVRASANTGEL